MAEVVKVVALVLGRGLEEYKAELESWAHDEDPEERWTDEQVKAELDRVSREPPRFGCYVEVVAELDTGERVSDECSRGLEFGPVGATDWRPTTAEVEAAVGNSLRSSVQPFRSFELLVQALERRGVLVDERALESAPFVVELDDAARRLTAPTVSDR